MSADVELATWRAKKAGRWVIRKVAAKRGVCRCKWYEFCPVCRARLIEAARTAPSPTQRYCRIHKQLHSIAQPPCDGAE